MLLVFGILIGMGLSLQTLINSCLRSYSQSPFVASLISFSVGTLFLTLLLWFYPHSSALSFSHLSYFPYWVWIGGALGVIALTTNILLFPYLGGLQTAIMPILGQIIMGLIIDQFGWFNSLAHPINAMKLLGIIFVLSGIFCAVVLPELRQLIRSTQQNKMIWLWRSLGIIAGMLSAAQASINGELGHLLQSPLQAAWVSFSVGTLILLLWVIYQGKLPTLGQLPFGKMPIWVWTGGLLGGIFVFGCSLLVPQIGTGQTVISTLLGMILAGLIIDHFALLNAPQRKIKPIQLLGILMLLVGVIFIRQG
ncbi:DMT family transporter [Volucribacter amazonae]|uniref:Transporter family-2 protein n=1 Tax=Volucribacter amazonae TaxID=256731 RepID=A0A9X4PBS4_9PAST|nr:DMT family transporter [Volucribacter amazonae]MDG6895247.1 hypothetical protein [Volucribacter amazonae]